MVQNWAYLSKKSTLKQKFIIYNLGEFASLYYSSSGTIFAVQSSLNFFENG